MTTPFKGSVTISASFGTRGTQIGLAVSERLGLPFLDRAIPGEAARQLHLSDESAKVLDERAPSRWERLAAAFGDLGPAVESAPATSGLLGNASNFRMKTESLLKQAADTTGAVILGRAGMVVLAGRPDVLSVRLDGPTKARVAQALADGAEEKNITQVQKDLDGAREGYARFFYNVHQDNPQLYHLVIDATAFSSDACVDLIARAAEARFAEASLSRPD